MPGCLVQIKEQVYELDSFHLFYYHATGHIETDLEMKQHRSWPVVYGRPH